MVPRLTSLCLNITEVAPAIHRLKHRRDFLLAAQQGRKWSTEGLVLQLRNRVTWEALHGLEFTAIRVGFTVTKKVGNSVIRNRVRRRLKAAADEVLGNTEISGMDLVIIGRMGTIKRPYSALIKDLQTALKKLKFDKRASRRD
jgi:ribonuclease P protein component